MDTFKSFTTLLPAINAQSFDKIALELFRIQAANNPVYQQYIKALRIQEDQVNSIEKIPFLPIRFFKTHLLKTGEWNPEEIYQSSGTTGMVTSTHPIYSTEDYLLNARYAFEQMYGALTDYHILALLPSYLERKHSSLVAMISRFIELSNSEFSGFYLHNTQQLMEDVERLKKGSRKVLVWGVTYALLDLAERFKPDWSEVMVFETGGMKGKRKEITRETLHQILMQNLKINSVYSEYGMTELLSQAYTRGGSLFYPSSTMKILIREVADPLHVGLRSETGGINVIDLANIHSIAFIETEDLGRVYNDGNFEVLGRIDNSDIRGCNLMVE